jgi:hypothetical protein
VHYSGAEVMPKMDTIPEAARINASCIAGHDVDDSKRINFMSDRGSEVC